MAARSSPDVMQRKPVGASLSPSPSESATLLLGGEAKENVGRKPLPPPSGSNSRRAPGAPMAPVKLNVQPGEWPPASNGAVEADEGRLRPASNGQEDVSRYENYSGKLRTQNLPYRPSYTIQESEHQQPQMASIVSAEHSDSRSSLNGSSQPYQDEEPMDELEPPPVPHLQYHHQSTLSEASIQRNRMPSPQNNYSIPNEGVNIGQSINRHLSPNSQTARRTPQIPRPMSAYSDSGPNRRSPYTHSHSPSWSGRTPSAQSGRSDGRPLSFLDLNNVSYPQMPPPPISFDNSQLRGIVGSHASLLSTQKTLEMYRQNIKKLNDPETQYAFAVFLVSASAEAADQDQHTPQRKVSPRPGSHELDGPYVEKPSTTAQELLNEAKHILQRLSDRSYPFAQYYLGDGYASGLFSKNKEEDNSSAFPLFVSASKHGHAEAGYRAALCYEFGWGCRKDPAKAVQFLRHSASKNHPGAMTRLGRACLSGDLGENKYREGVKWLKRGSESADAQYNAAPYHLGQLYEKGCGDDIFQDEAYAAQLYTQAADLGHGEAAYRMGDAYEHGRLMCPRDPALSVHFYTCSAQTGHPGAMMALCAWYMIGAEPVLEKDEDEAYEWAREAAMKGLTKAEYAVGYFTEMGIGTRRDPLEANVWYVKAAAAGDDRARIRIAAINAAASGGTPKPMAVSPPRNESKMKRSGSGNEKVIQAEKDKECIVM